MVGRNNGILSLPFSWSSLIASRWTLLIQLASLSLILIIMSLIRTPEGESMSGIDISGPDARDDSAGQFPHCRQVWSKLDKSKPYVIGHRGSPGEFPDHSTVGYLSAINHGADFIECCDVVMTKDLVLICRHEPLISNTTNADDMFPEERRTYIIDGTPSTGVHAIDLTLEQIQMLSVRQPLYERSQVFDDHFSVVTLEQCLDMALGAPRVVGVYPEIKHPSWHDAILLERDHSTITITDLVLNLLKAKAYDNELNSEEWLKRPIFLQSFEPSNLKYVHTKSKIPLIQLLEASSVPVPDGTYPTYESLMSDEGMRAIATYGKGIGGWKESLINISRGKIESTGIVERAHAAGLQVHIYTLRNEPRFRTKTMDSNSEEFELFFKTLGVDGGFSDYPGTLMAWMREESSKGTAWPNLII